MEWHIFTPSTMKLLFITTDPAVALAWSVWGFFVAEDILVRVPNVKQLTTQQIYDAMKGGQP